ncbi:MAG TPA: tetratricopeptide repeat protein, partial [Polyangiaceae bacterium]|nr:tetratricopeptide repeat protein [Polyangiaceae bacterium]
RRPAWPVLGLEESARALYDRLVALRSGGGIVVTGPRGSGRTTLLKRLSWSLEMGGEKVAWVPPSHADPAAALAIELEGKGDGEGLVVIVDDADLAGEAVADKLASLREHGAKVVVSGRGAARVPGATLEVFEIPPLGAAAARELVLYAMPAVSEQVTDYIVERSERWPGRVRAIVERLAGSPVVGPSDVDRLAPPEEIEAAAAGPSERRPGERADVAAIRAALERGHFEEAGDLLATREGDRAIELSVLRARFLLARAEWRAALDELQASADQLEDALDAEAAEYLLELARAHLRAGDNAGSERVAGEVAARFGDVAPADRRLAVAIAEARAVGGLAKSFLSRHDEAREDLARAVDLAEAIGEPRTLSIAYGSLAFAHQRSGMLDEAKVAYERALAHAESAGDAGTVASTRLNLAAISKAQGDLAAALAHLEAAVDMGKRSGRRSTLRQALLNLANLDLYLGRLARADVSIAELATDRDDLPPHMAAQLVALEAESAAKAGDGMRAEALCLACARAYEALGRQVDAGEAKVESIFAALGRVGGEPAALSALQSRLAEAETALSGVATHRAALELARGRLLALAGDPGGAAVALDRGVAAAIETGKRDWLVRIYQARAALFVDEGQHMAARRDREAALTILEATASKLPRDLREVYWDEPTRRSLRDAALSSHTNQGGVTVNAT